MLVEVCIELLRVKPISALTVGFYVHCVLGLLLSLVLGIVRLLNSFEMTRSDYQGRLLSGLRVLSLPVSDSLAELGLRFWRAYSTSLRNGLAASK
jgi:hypothetical protein